MDKLKYVKLENEDGSYSSSIPLAVDSDYVDVNGSTLTTVIGNKADTSTVTSSISNLQSQISGLASGSPKGTYATISALASANPDTGVYIITADGHLYSWIKNASEAIDLGVYQATGLSDGEVAVNHLNSDIKEKMGISYPTYSVIAEKYVTKSGSIADSSNFDYAGPISINCGQTISFLGRGYLTNVAMISECDENGSNIKVKVISSDSTTKIYSYTATKNTYILLSNYHNYFANANVTISNDGQTISEYLGQAISYKNFTSEEIDVMFKNITNTLEHVSDKYITSSLYANSNNYFDYYILPTKKGSLYYIDTVGASLGAQIVLDYGLTIPTISSGYYYGAHIIKGTGATIYINYEKQNNHNLYIGEAYEDNVIDEIPLYFNELTSSDYTVSTNTWCSKTGRINESNGFTMYTIEPELNYVYYFKTSTSAEAPICYQEDGYILPNTSGSYGNVKTGYYYVVAQNENLLYINSQDSHLRDGVKIYKSKFPIVNIPDPEPIDLENRTIGLISNAVFCGDSLTYGATYDAENHSYQNYYNYPYYMKKLLNLDSIEEYARGGATSTSWWNRFSENIQSTHSLYFVWLCTNDTFTDTVNTDCAGDDWENYAETETGYLGKILGKISSLEGNKIILLNQFAHNGSKTTNNSVLQQMAEKFNCVLIDVATDELLDSKYHTAYNGYYNAVHFNNIGHRHLANIVNQQLNEYLKTHNLEVYKQHQ